VLDCILYRGQSSDGDKRGVVKTLESGQVGHCLNISSLPKTYISSSAASPAGLQDRKTSDPHSLSMTMTSCPFFLLVIFTTLGYESIPHYPAPEKRSKDLELWTRGFTLGRVKVFA
jgi:hypothetical protein